MALKLKKNNAKVKKIVKKVQSASANAAKTAAIEAGSQNPDLKYATGRFTQAIGRRKVATARVRLYESEGDFIVNDLVVGEYFATVPHASVKYMQPFELTGTKGKFAVQARVGGSGTSAQLDAVVHGIARALIAFDPENRAVLKKAGLLTRDDRMKETRKIGTGGKARRKRQSPKR